MVTEAFGDHEKHEKHEKGRRLSVRDCRSFEARLMRNARPKIQSGASAGQVMFVFFVFFVVNLFQG